MAEHLPQVVLQVRDVVTHQEFQGRLVAGRKWPEPDLLEIVPQSWTGQLGYRCRAHDRRDLGVEAACQASTGSGHERWS